MEIRNFIFLVISKAASFQAIELRAQAHIKLGNTDKAMEDLQSFIHVGTVKRAKRNTPEKVSGSSNTIGDLVDAKAEADSNQNYKKINVHTCIRIYFEIAILCQQEISF